MNSCEQCTHLHVGLERAKTDLARDARRLANTDDGPRKGHSSIAHLRTNIEHSKALVATNREELARHQRTCLIVSMES